MLSQRLLFGPVLIIVACLSAMLDNLLGVWGGVWTRGLVLAVLGGVGVAFGAWELARLQQDKGVAASSAMMGFAAVAGMLTSAIGPRLPVPGDAAMLMVSTGAATLLAAVFVYARNKSVDGMFAELAGVLLSFLYLGGLLGFYIAMRVDFDAWVVLWVIMNVKSCDIGAYFTGRAFGRHKLAPWISPGKTWEGFAGGTVFAAGVGALGAWVLVGQGLVTVPVWGGALLGAMLAISGQVGDLVISLLKRDAGRKDASKTLPGFGGVLDVLDSLLLAAPIAFWGLRLLSGVE